MITTRPTSEIAQSHDQCRQIYVPKNNATGLKEMILRLRNVFNIPVGYQDETGFHSGPEFSPVAVSFEI